MGIVPIVPKEYCSLRKCVFYGVINFTTSSPNQPGSTLFLSPLVVRTGPSNARIRCPNGVATRLPLVVDHLDDMCINEMFFLWPNNLTCGSLLRSAWQHYHISVTDRLLSGRLNCIFDTCNMNGAFVIGVVEIDCYGSDCYGYGRPSRRLVDALLVWKMGQLAGDMGHTSVSPAGGNKSYILCILSLIHI